jgi:hypothetical protein
MIQTSSWQLNGPINIAWSNTKRAVVAQETKSNLLILCAGIFDLIKSASFENGSPADHKVNKMRLFGNPRLRDAQCTALSIHFEIGLEP